MPQISVVMINLDSYSRKQLQIVRFPSHEAGGGVVVPRIQKHSMLRVKECQNKAVLST